MCFKKPRPPAPTDTGQSFADPELTIQRQQAELDAAQVRADNKDTRTQDKLALLEGRLGRSSLFTGSRGGAGYGAPQARSLFVQNLPDRSSGTAGTPPPTPVPATGPSFGRRSPGRSLAGSGASRGQNAAPTPAPVRRQGASLIKVRNGR